MARLPASVAEFLAWKRFAVAEVSRHPQQDANAIYRKLCHSGFELLPVNPNGAEAESVRCYPTLASIPGSIDGDVAATHPRTQGERQVWFHRSFGTGSVSREWYGDANLRGIQCTVSGCPLTTASLLIWHTAASAAGCDWVGWFQVRVRRPHGFSTAFQTSLGRWNRVST